MAKDIVLDLCGGSGSWSEPYRAAGYDVRVITLPDEDVRTYVPPLKYRDRVVGVLAAPPCTEFSLARNSRPWLGRDWAKGMECVNACMRIVLQVQPHWWALENPEGHLRKWLGPPRLAFHPCEYGDPWLKKTCIWGRFTVPRKLKEPVPVTHAGTELLHGKWARSLTPPAFARAFFKVNQ